MGRSEGVHMAQKKCLISEQIFTSADLWDLPFAARWLWLGLVVSADHETGLVQVRSSEWLRMRFLMHSHTVRTTFGVRAVDAWIHVFHTRGMLSTTTLDDVSYWKITNFFRHQHFASARREDKVREDEANLSCTPVIYRNGRRELDIKKWAKMSFEKDQKARGECLKPGQPKNGESLAHG